MIFNRLKMIHNNLNTLEINNEVSKVDQTEF